LFIYFYSFIHPIIHSFIHLFIYSFIHLFIYLFICLLIHSFVYLFTNLFIFSSPTGPRKRPVRSESRVYGPQKQVSTRGKTGPRRTSRTRIQIKEEEGGRGGGGCLYDEKDDQKKITKQEQALMRVRVFSSFS
jgi:hypothetical protein